MTTSHMLTTLVFSVTVCMAGELPGELQGLRVWKGDDGSRWVWQNDGTPKQISGPVKKFPWLDYMAYGAGTMGDYLSTKRALSKGGVEQVPWLRCSPHRPGCFNQNRWIAISVSPIIPWLLMDKGVIGSKHYREGKGSGGKVVRVARWVLIGSKVAVTMWNLKQ